MKKLRFVIGWKNGKPSAIDTTRNEKLYFSGTAMFTILNEFEERFQNLEEVAHSHLVEKAEEKSDE